MFIKVVITRPPCFITRKKGLTCHSPNLPPWSGFLSGVYSFHCCHNVLNPERQSHNPLLPTSSDLKKDIWCWSVRNQYKSVNTNTSNIYYLLSLNHDLDPVAEPLTLSYPLIKMWILDLINHLNWTSFQLSLFLNY